MEKIDTSDVECSSSTKITSHYSSGGVKPSHYGKSHGRGNHHHETSFGNPRQNQVSNVLLFGVPIVALIMDGKERLCLAQISSTLLKDFSYNEIHNRRVALGINCIQCTPVQLEILRRAGAMPVTSRRCGMITKREAERLCQSFLGDHAPPQLPENFAFDVIHECAWGCRGSFVPSRYNSSRAKCIRCTFCQLFFSPNKFIFHSHRLPTSRYVQPDAANFNSWRRHLKLWNSGSSASSSMSMDTKSEPLIGSSSSSVVNSGDNGSTTTASNVISSSGILQNESPATLVLASTPEIVHAWEDVKAMFNGGTRKRLLAVHSIPSTTASGQGSKQDQSRGEKNTGKKGAHGSSNPSLKRSAGSGSGQNFASSPITSPLQFQQQKQDRQTHLYSQHPQNAPFPVNLNHHQFALAAASVASHSSSFGGLTTNTHAETPRHAIWNPVNDDHKSGARANNAALNEIINAAINFPQQQQHQQPHHPAGLSAVLANPFPWFHRNLITAPPPPLFPLSHPFGSTSYKYLHGNESETSQNEAGKTSAFKPILPFAPDQVSPLQLGNMAGSSSFPLGIPSSNMEYPYLSPSSWLASAGFPGVANKKGMNPHNNESFSLPEDLSLNSAGGSVQHSSSSGSSPSSASNTSSSYSNAEYKANRTGSRESKSTNRLSSHASTTLSPREDHISPQPTQFNVKTTTGGWIRGSGERDQSSSDGESSDVDITDNEEDVRKPIASENATFNHRNKYEDEELTSPHNTQSFTAHAMTNCTSHIPHTPANSLVSSSQKKKPRLLNIN